MRIIAGLLSLLLMMGAPTWAQETSTDSVETTEPEASETVADLSDPFPDQDQWETLSTRVEAALETGLASSTVFSDLRNTLASWRDVFLERQSTNSASIATVNAQIEALGDAPEDGTEDLRVTQRRDDLAARLQQLRAPVILATEAHALADGLIGQIDAIIRGRQAARFLERTQSPLLPSGWAEAWGEMASALKGVRSETSTLIYNPSRQSEFVSRLPAIMGLLVVAFAFVLKGRDWFNRLTGAIAARSSRGRGVVRFLVSLGQVIVPFLGLVALTNALILTGMTGRRLTSVLENLPLFGLFPILGHWIAGHLLPKNHEPDEHPLLLTPSLSTRGHRRFVVLGYMLMLFCVVGDFLTANAFETVPFSVVLFPFGVLVAWPLYRFGHLLGRSGEEVPEGTARSFRTKIRHLLSRGLMIASFGGVVLAALGYSNAFDSLTYPAAVTIFVLAGLLLLQNLSVDVYTLLAKTEGAAQTALAPVLIGFLLVVLALPILALIWGAQTTDLTELWTQFQEGFSLGETQISPSSFMLFAVVFVVGYTVTRLVQAALRTTVLPRTKLDAGGQNAIVAGTGYIGIFVAAVIAITMAGIDLSGLAIVAGALSVGIGFGMQNIVSNFVSGIILLIERPISQGDMIEVGGQMGYVRDISVRSTRIETFDRTDVIVPNADLVSNQVTNWTRGNNVGRAIVPVGVAYGTDTDRVTEILKEIAEAQPMVLLNPPPNVFFMSFGADSLDFEIRAIIRDVNYVMIVKSQINHQIAKRFAEEGIEIPFAQRDLWLRNAETLQPGYEPPQAPLPKPDKDTAVKDTPEDT